MGETSDDNGTVCVGSAEPLSYGFWISGPTFTSTMRVAALGYEPGKSAVESVVVVRESARHSDESGKSAPTISLHDTTVSQNADLSFSLQSSVCLASRRLTTPQSWAVDGCCYQVQPRVSVLPCY